MSLPRFFLSDQVLSHETESVFALQLSPDDLKHARVLRLRAGEHIAVIDASSDYFECEVVEDPREGLVVAIAEKAEGRRREPNIVVVQGLAKGDKMETVIRHATEVGACSFIPLSCERSVLKLDAKKAASKRDRWQAIAKSAAMQSGRSLVPNVLAPVDLAGVGAALRDADAVLVCWEEAPQTATIDRALARACARAHYPSNEDVPLTVAIVIGPEGGLTEREVSFIERHCAHACSVTLGSTILRTETAGIVAPAIVRYELDRLTRAALGAQSDRDADTEANS